MASLNLMSLNDDVLRELCVVAASLHPPHWQRKGPDQPHDKARAEESDESDEPQRRRPVLVTARKSTGGKAPRRRMRATPATYCLGWIYLSHVNRRLRQICLLLSSLWADNVFCIPSSSRAVLETMFARARQAPLTMIVTAGTGRSIFPPSTKLDEYYAKIALVLENLDRATVCRVQPSPDDDDIDWVSAFDGQVFPRLRALALNPIYWTDGDLPQRILKLTAPNLIELHLTHELFPSSMTMMVSLRKLNITLVESNIDRTALLSNDPLFDLLKCVPALEELNLSLYFSPIAESGAEIVQSSVKLVRLRKADIWMRGPPVKHTTWSRIEAPVVADLRLHFGINDEDVLIDIGIRAAASQLAHPKHCAIKLTEDDSKLALRVTSIDGGSDKSVLLDWDDYIALHVDYIFNVLPIFIVPSNMTRLHFDGLTAREDETTLLVFLRALPAVTDFILENVRMVLRTGATEGQAIFVHPLGSFASEPSILPALRTLEIGYGHGSYKYYRRHWETIVVLLQARSAAGNPVQTVKLFGLRLSRAGATALDAKMINVVSAHVQEIVDNRPPLVENAV